MNRILSWMFVIFLIVLIIDPSQEFGPKKRRNGQRKHGRRDRQPIRNCGEEWLYATVEVQPNPSIPTSNVKGTIHFRQKLSGHCKRRTMGTTQYNVSLTGFDNTDDILKHGSHIHTYGTITGGCEGAGGHYNPTETTHALPSNRTRHIGDLANVVEDEHGNANHLRSNNMIHLYGRHSIVGRTWDVHVTMDDGTGRSGNAGPRLACGAVVVSDGSKWK